MIDVTLLTSCTAERVSYDTHYPLEGYFLDFRFTIPLVLFDLVAEDVVLTCLRNVFVVELEPDALVLSIFGVELDFFVEIDGVLRTSCVGEVSFRTGFVLIGEMEEIAVLSLDSLTRRFCSSSETRCLSICNRATVVFS